MQPAGTIWTTLVGDHPGIIPVKFGQNPMSSFRGEDVLSKNVYAWQRTTEKTEFTIAHLEHKLDKTTT